MKLPLAILLACTAAAPANALCMHNGTMYAKTTLAQEFREARWVVRAHVVAVDYHWSDEDESWTAYRLRVVKSFKGPPLRRFTFFTTRDSGGFYLDADGGGPDLDRDYLLFLLPVEGKHLPSAAKGALWENYNCGQSKLWGSVTSAERRALDKLRGRR